MFKPFLIVAASIMVLASCSAQNNDTEQAGTGAASFGRDTIKIVGSSTVYPFSTVVSERFGRKYDFGTPVVESTGSGGGLKLFCAGIGAKHPDIANASRRIKQSEIDNCASNGIDHIIEIQIGFDGIVLANSRKSAQMSLTLRELFLALAKTVPGVGGQLQPNPYQTWDQINPGLPNVNIEVLGPPPTSGTRDAFVELAMEGGCDTFPTIKALKATDKAAHKILCHTLREDGGFVEAGENDNLIVQKLNANPSAFGIFGYSFLEQNADLVQGSIIDGEQPEFAAITSGDYPIARSLFFYVKYAHVGQVGGLAEFMAEFTSDEAAGAYGYLGEKGLIPLSDAGRLEMRERAISLQNIAL